MTDEQMLNETETSPIEVKPEAAVQAEAAQHKTDYKPADYEYNSWSQGVPAPDGWERCPDYPTVIRRLKMAPPADSSTGAKTKAPENGNAVS